MAYFFANFEVNAVEQECSSTQKTMQQKERNLVQLPLASHLSMLGQNPKIEVRVPEVHGRIDILTPGHLIECKQVLTMPVADQARGQLRRYSQVYPNRQKIIAVYRVDNKNAIESLKTDGIKVMVIDAKFRKGVKKKERKQNDRIAASIQTVPSLSLRKFVEHPDLSFALATIIAIAFMLWSESLGVAVYDQNYLSAFLHVAMPLAGVGAWINSKIN